MKHGDAIQSVTHVSDVNRYPCSGLNKRCPAVAASPWWRRRRVVEPGNRLRVSVRRWMTKHKDVRDGAEQAAPTGPAKRLNLHWRAHGAHKIHDGRHDVKGVPLAAFEIVMIQVCW